METWKQTEMVAGCKPDWTREISCLVADEIAQWKRGLWGINLWKKSLFNCHYIVQSTFMLQHEKVYFQLRYILLIMPLCFYFDRILIRRPLFLIEPVFNVWSVFLFRLIVFFSSDNNYQFVNKTKPTFWSVIRRWLPCHLRKPIKKQLTCIFTVMF